MTLTVTAPEVGRGSIRQKFDRGIHPATLLPVLVAADGRQPAQCGGCAAFRVRVVEDGSTRNKCAAKATRRRGPDMKPDFPACTGFRPAPAAALPGTI